MAAEKGNFLPKKGNLLRLEDGPPSTTPHYEQIIAAALRQELGGSHKSEKMLMRWTGASGRTVKNWVSGLRGPSGIHLVALMRNSDAMFEAVLMIAGRQRAITPEKIATTRVHLIELLALLDAEIGRQGNDESA